MTACGARSEYHFPHDDINSTRQTKNLIKERRKKSWELFSWRHHDAAMSYAFTHVIIGNQMRLEKETVRDCADLRTARRGSIEGRGKPCLSVAVPLLTQYATEPVGSGVQGRLLPARSIVILSISLQAALQASGRLRTGVRSSSSNLHPPALSYCTVAVLYQFTVATSAWNLSLSPHLTTQPVTNEPKRLT
jgi:hypothetical protein